MAEQKFPCEGIGISLRGNWNFLVRGFMRHAAGLRALGLMLVLMGLGASWNGAWADRIIPTYPDNNENSPKIGRSTEVIYANNGNIDIRFQDNAADCIDGYIRWYVEDNEGKETKDNLTPEANSSFRSYDNGFVWVHDNSNNAAPDNVNYIRYNYQGGEVTVVVEGSSIRNTLPQSGDYKSPMVSIQRRYVIKPAKDRAADLDARKDLLAEIKDENNKAWWESSDAFKKLLSVDRNDYYLDNYEIHVPLGRKVTFRLSEKLSNYFVPVQTQSGGFWGSQTITTYVAATSVRWNVFNANGSRTDNSIFNDVSDYKWTTNVYSSSDIWNNVSLNDDATQTQKFYLVAEVGYNNVFYPASFITLYVEPNAKPLTETELQNPVYKHRTTAYLENQGYVNIAELNFNDIDGDGVEDIATPTAANNFAENPIANANSYYAYAYPGEFEYRKGKRLSVGRQEYGLYRTLNMENVSRSPVTESNEHENRTPLKITEENSGIYNEYFTATKGNANYNRVVVDRSYSNGEGGFFLYLDAADEPGVITKIRMDDRLCNDMRLVVTAWVCDMSASDDESDRVYADVGFTFKGVRSVNEGGTTTEEETILTKYYSGTIGRPEQDSGDGEHALWQQIYFTFNYFGTEEDYDYFILEISNNSRGSNGADYGIDEICVMRSTPRVDVRRMEACDASTLTVNTDYETILANMGWTAGQEVSASASRPANYAQYGYGLPSDYYGNIYFAFLEGLTEDAEGNISDEEKTLAKGYLEYSSSENLSKDIVPRTLPSSGNQYRWVRVNRNLTVPSYQSVYSFRTIITTNEDDIPRGTNAQAEALKQEKQYNFQAVLDYNADSNQLWAGDDNTRKGTIDITADGTITTIDANDGLIASRALTEENISDSQYDEIYTILTEALYARLQIPRIRCPWFATVNGEEKLFLYEMNVEHTDLMYAGEQYIEDDKIKTAEGRYHVMVFSGQQISGYPTPTNVPYSEISNTCSLVSSFPVQGSLVIRIDAETESDVLACEGTLRKISAALKNRDTGEELDTGYSFDWFFGSLEEYNAITFDGNIDLQGAINYVRNQLNKDSFTYDDVEDWDALESGESAIRIKLMELMNPENPKIAIDKNNFDWAISSDKIVAMPFVKTDDVDTNLYCTEIQEAPVPLYSIDVPQLHPGYTMTTNPFKGEVALRLGHPNMDTQMELAIPLQSGFEKYMAEEAQSLRIPETGGVDISWNNIEEGFPTVGTAQQVTINRDATDAKVTITLNAGAKAKLQEGQRYELRIPFRQYDENDQPLESKCDGVIILPIKVVPKYLTWKGGSSDNWYDESKWNQSTKKDLYFTGWNGTDADKDANGPDEEGNYEEITDAYSPLYFTKITIPDGSELALDELSTTTENAYTFLTGWAEDGSDSIRYEMAVVDATGDIKPYYINKVDQIYFKPNATLLNQHLLDYQKAWVEFEMANMEKRWMASPLQNVYAGDIYAPTGDTYKGRQETPAFTDITYTKSMNSRWAPAFYQKAWNHDVQYSEVEGTPNDNQIATVKAVKNNWSIEYNDVTVQYPIGKGFYLSVEDIPGEAENRKALVRLPKADKSYEYEKPLTKALNATTRTEKAGRLAELENGEYVLNLEIAGVYNNDQYYLIGNPAMAYLNMKTFLEKNNITKYWTYQKGTFSATVDNMTDDDKFIDTGSSTAGYIAPMQAFFIEWSKGEDAEKKVSFTPDMFVSKPEDSGTESISYNAFNPTLTLTAERGDQRSVAKLATREDAHDGYEESEDAIALIDSELDVPVVYTVAGTAAAQVNALQTIRNVGLGVYNEAGGEVTVAIEGMSQLMEPLYLYDAKTRKSVELVGDRYELTVDGESHGRYFLRSGLSTDNDRIHTGDDISIYSLRPGEIVVTTVGTPLRSVRVYGIDGDLVTQQTLANQTAYRLNVPRGAIYVVYAEDADGIIRNVKLRVR